MGLLLIVPESEIDPGSVPDPDRSLLTADLELAVSCVNLSPVEFRKLGEGIVGEELVLTVGFEALADLFDEV